MITIKPVALMQKPPVYSGANGGIFRINCLYHEIEVGL